MYVIPKRNTMRTNFAVAGTMVLALAALAGCKLHIAPEVYLSDLRVAAVDDESGLTTSTRISVQIPSSDECAKYRTEISKVVHGMFPEYAIAGCRSEGFESFLDIDAMIPLVNTKMEWDDSRALLGILSLQDNGDISVGMLLNTHRYDVLSKRMKDEFFQDLDLTDSRIRLIVNNDARRTKHFIVEGVFLNGDRPVLKAAKFPIKRRQKVEITLSNVAASSLARHGEVPVIRVLY